MKITFWRICSPEPKVALKPPWFHWKVKCCIQSSWPLFILLLKQKIKQSQLFEMNKGGMQICSKSMKNHRQNRIYNAIKFLWVISSQIKLFNVYTDILPPIDHLMCICFLIFYCNWLSTNIRSNECQWNDVENKMFNTRLCRYTITMHIS